MRPPRLLLTLTAGLLACSAAPPEERPAAVSAEEQAATIAGLKPPHREPARARPVIAVLALNEGTETTDFLVPYGVLKRADVAEVLAVGMGAGPITLMPALTVQPELTAAELDARYPDGADYVVVPALHTLEAPALLAWLKAQAGKGATVIGICEGVRVLGKAGLLDGRGATTHWFSVDALRADTPTMRWVKNRRYVVDRGVATTTGVTASLPLSLALVEAIAGRERATAVAAELGVEAWGPEHDSAAFHLDLGHVWTLTSNAAAFWDHQDLGLPVEEGVDELALAFAADANSRTYRSQVRSIAAAEGELTTRYGLRLVPDQVEGKTAVAARLPSLDAESPGRALDGVLGELSERYGHATAAWVALQLEYPWK